MRVAGKDYRTVWMEGSVVKTINQPLIPHKFEIVTLSTHRETAKAIKAMVLRGAGAIGAAALARKYQIEKGRAESDFCGFKLAEVQYDVRTFTCDGCSIKITIKLISIAVN